MVVVVPVSVVIPCYKCAATIERAVLSVFAQTVKPAEVILVDDASPDETMGKLQALQNRYGTWVRILQMPSNVGAASARNAGWSKATQTYIAFLDADDAWHPRKLELQYAYMQSNPAVMLSSHLCRQLSQRVDNALDWQVELGRVESITWGKFLIRHQFVTPSVMLKREIRFRFAEGMRYMEDHRLWLEIVAHAMPVVRLEVELAAIFKPAFGASGLSANLWDMEKAELSNYRYFFENGRIPFMLFHLLQAYSLAKFLRRWLWVRWSRCV